MCTHAGDTNERIKNDLRIALSGGATNFTLEPLFALGFFPRGCAVVWALAFGEGCSVFGVEEDCPRVVTMFCTLNKIN